MKRPNFLIVGAAKSGTTSLHHYLNQHPNVYMPMIKETYFLTGLTSHDFPPYFKNPIVDSLEDYDRLFTGARDSEAVGEACVAYLYFYKQTIPHIKAYLHDPRIIIVLRNPVDRAFSHFLELKALGYEELTFEQAIEIENDRALKGHWWWSSQYVDIGRYSSQVAAYIAAFGREQVTVFLYEDFAQNPHAVTTRIFRDIGVDGSFLPDVRIRHKSTGVAKNQLWSRLLIKDNRLRGLYRSILPFTWRSKIHSDWIARLRDKSLRKPALDPATRQTLQEVYWAEIKRLQTLTGIDFEKWWWRVEEHQASL